MHDVRRTHRGQPTSRQMNEAEIDFIYHDAEIAKSICPFTTQTIECQKIWAVYSTNIFSLAWCWFGTEKKSDAKKSPAKMIDDVFERFQMTDDELASGNDIKRV